MMAEKKSNTVPLSLQLMRLLFSKLGPLFPTQLGDYAYRLWMTPRRTKAPDIEQMIVNKAKASDVVLDGLKIRLWSWGEGPTILFMHGWGGRGTQISSFVEPFNLAGFKIMSFDMPGHGYSQGKQTNAYEIANITSKVIQQIDNLHSIITHSFGGAILGFFYSPSLPLKNMVLICPPANMQTPFKQFTEMLELPATVNTYLLNKLEKNFGKDVFEQLSLTSNAAKITQPVLVIHDREDDVVPVEDGKAVANALKKGTFYETNELGHRKILFDPTVIKHILEYISKSK